MIKKKALRGPAQMAESPSSDSEEEEMEESSSEEENGSGELSPAESGEDVDEDDEQHDSDENSSDDDNGADDDDNNNDADDDGEKEDEEDENGTDDDDEENATDDDDEEENATGDDDEEENATGDDDEEENATDDDDEEENATGDDDNGKDNNKSEPVSTPEVHKKPGEKRRISVDSGDAECLKKPKLDRSSLYTPPTNEELHQLKETENLFQSSLFRLQISELLSEVQLKKTRREKVDKFVSGLRETLLALAAGPNTQLTDQKWLEKKKYKGIQCPLHQLPPCDRGEFQFLPPECVEVVGSYALRTCIKPHVTVDLALVLPKGFVQSKDYLNQRYLRKRALYLACVAKQLVGSDVSLSFTHLHGNHMLPVLCVSPPGKLASQVEVRLYPCLQDGTFKLSRFHVSKNNVRQHWFSGQDEAANNRDCESSDASTPHYNSTMLHGLTMLRHHAALQEVLSDSQGLVDGLMLLKVWLRQRQLSQGSGGFSGFVISMLVLHLVSKRRLNRLMSSYQVLRNTLIYLAQADLRTEGISLASVGDSQDSEQPDMTDMHNAFDVVFLDHTGYLNICALMNTATFARVRHEAGLSVAALETVGVDGFEALLMTPVNFLHKFDQVIHVSKMSCLQNLVVKQKKEDQVANHSGSLVTIATTSMLDLLQKALGQRLQLLCVAQTASKTWAVTESASESACEDDVITFGLLLNPEHCFSIIDKGPPADSTQANDFREFWGEKSELRRFQDGSICEAVVWTAKTQADRRRVPGKIVKHILDRHAGIPRDAITIIGHQVECVLNYPPASKKKRLTDYGTGEEQHLAAIHAYDALGKNLRVLSGLPLEIHSIQGTAPVFRYAEVLPPLPGHCTASSSLPVKDNCGHVPIPHQSVPPFTPTLTVQCLLETSGKWPEDAEAVRRLRAAFHISLGKALGKQCHLPTSIHPDHVLVLKNGYVFRVQIGYLREISLLKMTTLPDGKVRMSDNEASTNLERQLVALPRLASNLHGIQQHHGSYCSAVRLCKRWVAAHLLTDHVPPEAVELLVARLYLHPEPLTPPSAPQTCFLRFLHLVAHHDWQMAPLFVNLNNEFKREDYVDIQTKFRKERSTLPLMYVATPSEKSTHSPWTRRQPSAPILKRLVLLARESLAVLESQLMDTHIKLDFKQIFRPPLEHFDVIIHLKATALARQHEAVDLDKACSVPIPDNTTPIRMKHIPVVNFDPALVYLQELRESFDDLALFFHDPLGGRYIAVLWRPPALKSEDFKISHANWRRLQTAESDKDVQLVPNMAAILNDFKVMGSGLVREIETRDSCTET